MKQQLSNHKISWFLHRIADYLEIDGENSFKVAAYRKAAQAVEDFSKPIGEETNLEKIPNVGKGTGAVIRELLTTGESSYLNELKKKLPPDLFTILRIPGLGPKSVGRLYRELGIDTLEQLEIAAKKRKIRALSGFGAKTEIKIIQGIKQMKEKPTSIPIAIALPIAQEIKGIVEKIADVEKVALAGSLRRMQETVKDIDFVISTKEERKVAHELTQIPGITEVVLSGETRVSIIMEYLWPIQLDFLLTTPERFSAALLHFTGSQEHNIRLRQRAKEQGLKLNEDGIIQGENGDIIETFHAEEDIYRRLGLSFIPPEIREGGREVKEAETETGIPRLIRLEDIRGDLHMHTNWSDGGNTVEEMAEAAYKRGYQYIAITDHSRSLKIAGGLSIERLLKQKEEIKKLEKKLREKWDDFSILCGVEMDILGDGMLDYPDEFLMEMDLVIGSIHSSFQQDEKMMTKRIIGAIENNHVDFIAHPTGRLIGRRDPYAVNIDILLKAAKETGTALELNANPNRLDLKAELLQRAIEEYGIYITINTDAHSVSELNNIEVGIGTARRGWVRPEYVINTWPLDKLRQYLQRNDVP